MSKDEKRNTYSGGSDFSFKALTVKTKRFKQLKEPFPYYYKEPLGPKNKANTNKAVSKLNSHLEKFYNKQKN